MSEPDRPAVPGLEPADGRPLDVSQDPDRFVPEEHPRVVEPVRGLDMSQDPDRYDPDRDQDGDAAEVPQALDMSQDPDRYLPPGQGQTLTDLLGAGAQADDRDGYQWVAGLVGVFAFLALVAYLFGNVLTP